MCFFIQAPPTNIQLDNLKEEYHIGENVTCTAEGNPEPSIYWMDENSGDTIDSSTLNITSAMKGLQKYSCVAWNEIKGETYENKTIVKFRVRLSGMCSL